MYVCMYVCMYVLAHTWRIKLILIKELDSHAKHVQSFKKRFGVFSVPNTLLLGSYKFWKVFFYHGIPCMATSLRRACAQLEPDIYGFLGADADTDIRE